MIPPIIAFTYSAFVLFPRLWLFLLLLFLHTHPLPLASHPSPSSAFTPFPPFPPPPAQNWKRKGIRNGLESIHGGSRLVVGEGDPKVDQVAELGGILNPSFRTFFGLKRDNIFFIF
jgi:hypothetical protein